MHALTVVPVAGAEERLETALVRILGRSVYEMRTRLGKGNHPVVLTSFADRAAAEDAHERLEAYGFETYLLGPQETETEEGRFLVRRFELRDEVLVAQSTGGERLEVPYSAVELLLRGTRATASSQMETVEKRKFSALRTVLSGGLVTSARVKVREKVEQEAREGFLHVYASGLPPVVLREGRVQFGGLGEQLRSTRHENFLHAQDVIRQRSSRARYDDRLLTRAIQAKILGPALPPIRHLDLAISLLARVLRNA